MTVDKIAVIGIAMVSGVLAFQAPPSGSLEPVFRAFEQRLLEGQNTRELLGPGRESLTQVVRKVPEAALSWQLEPSLLPELKDDEIFDFITARADSLLSCSLETYSKFSVEEAPDRVETSVRNLFWSGEANSGPMRISPDCWELVDSRNETIYLRSRNDFMNAQKIQKAFNTTVRARQFSAKIGNAPLVLENLSYLKREYGAPPQEEPEMRDALGAPVYSGLTAVLQTFVIDQKGRVTPFFVAPLSH